MTLSPRHAVLVATLIAAPSLAIAAPDEPWPPPGPGPRMSVRSTHACGTHQVRGVGLGPIPRAAAGQRTVFLNRGGGTYHIVSGATNSATMTANRSVTADGRAREAVIAPLAADFDWTAISACVQDHYQLYDLRFVETRPTSGRYLEAVVGGTGSELGFSASFGLLGVASADNFCGVTEAGICFSLAEAHRSFSQRDDELCVTIAHELGHLLALEHETLAIDMMSYVFLSDSGMKSFVDRSSPCGVEPGQNEACSCGGSSTNSGGRLTTFVGRRPTETIPPSLEVIEPDDGDKVAPSFTVIADATDDSEMSEVSALVDGASVGNSATPDGDRYTIALAGIADGAHTLTVRARDRAGNQVVALRDITVARLAIGESCTGGEQCAGEQCVAQGNDTFCTQLCDVGNDTCPDGWTCTQAGGIAVCAGGNDGGCCDAGQRPGPGTGLLVLGVGLLLVRTRTRSRSRRALS